MPCRGGRRRHPGQGFGAGAEQAGASTLMAEYAPPARRGYYAALPFVGIQVGMLLVTALFIPLAQLDEDVLFGMVSDRIGRVPLYRMAALFQAVSAVPSFALMSSGNTVLICVVITLGIGVGVNGMLGAQCALLAELFGARHRYTGVAIGREFSAIVAGGIAPLLGATLFLASNDAWWPLEAYVVLLSLVTFVTTFVTPETRGRDRTGITDAR
ncbi:MFS transporter [Streptomyces europaeiscabiei]|uniref:MFS transporter n=1 Tax=Streptomyces europaeiscabiei TaxID=146819 RepID=UPI0038F662D6